MSFNIGSCAKALVSGLIAACGAAEPLLVNQPKWGGIVAVVLAGLLGLGVTYAVPNAASSDGQNGSYLDKDTSTSSSTASTPVASSSVASVPATQSTGSTSSAVTVGSVASATPVAPSTEPDALTSTSTSATQAVTSTGTSDLDNAQIGA